MALPITSSSATAMVTVTKTLFDIVSLTTLSTVISSSTTANIANATPIFTTNGTTSSFSPFASLTSNSSNITTSTTTKAHRGSSPWWLPLLGLPIAVFLVIIWVAILLVVLKTKSPWLDFMRYDVNPQIRAEREKASAERQTIEEQLKKLDEEEAAHKRKTKDYDQSLMADFSRILRFRSRASNLFLKSHEEHISDDYSRFEATDGQKRLTDLEILKILILEHEEKYGLKTAWEVKHPVEYKKLELEFGYRVDEILEAEKLMREERNDSVADERDRVEMCEKFGWDPTDPFFKLP